MRVRCIALVLALSDLVDRFSTVRMPWHDIACVLFNKAATDVGRHFIQRWNHAKKVKASSKSSDKYPLLLPRSTNTSYKRLPPFIKDLCELVNCQVRQLLIFGGEQLLCRIIFVITDFAHGKICHSGFWELELIMSNIIWL